MPTFDGRPVVTLAEEELNPRRVVAGGFGRLPTELRCLLRMLDADYGYKQSHFAGRVTAHSLAVADGKPALGALSLDASPGFPFLLAVALSEAPAIAQREAAIRFALDTGTISTVLLCDDTAAYREILRRNFRENRFDPVSSLPTYRLPKASGQLSLFNQGSQRERCGASPAAITNKLEDLFFQMHSIMRDEDGLHADEALEELCKLLHLKTSTELSNVPVGTVALRSVEETSAFVAWPLHTLLRHERTSAVGKQASLASRLQANWTLDNSTRHSVWSPRGIHACGYGYRRQGPSVPKGVDESGKGRDGAILHASTGRFDDG